MKETINNEVEDLYLEHSQHLVYESKCSECYKYPPLVELNKEGFIVLKKDEVVEEIDFEICKNCSRPCSDEYCYTCLIEKKENEDSSEVERERDDYEK